VRLFNVMFIGAISLVFFAACGSESSPSPQSDTAGTAGPSGADVVLADSAVATESPTYYRDIKPLLDAMCVRCHTAGGVRASVPLDNEEDATVWAEAIRDQVASLKMPPWKATKDCKEYAFDESLTEEEIARVESWVEGGALPGVETDPPILARPVEFANLSRIDVTVEMPAEYTPQLSPDDYRCFLMPWDGDKTTYITGFGALPGNPEVVHHVIAYLIEPDAAATYVAWDQAEETPGYTCFGGPAGPGGESTGLGSGVRFLGGWAPGGVGGDFPPGTGMRVEPGSYIALQVHYNTFNNDPEPDLTSVVFKTDDSVEHEALVQPWTKIQWVMGQGMKIPAGEEHVEHTWGADPFSLPIDLFDGATGLRLYSASLHMHNLGKGGTTYIERADGTTECLLNIDDYDFGWQRSYGFKEPTEIRKGDKLTIHCEWDNSAANQPYLEGKKIEPRDQHWGEGTTDEMCVGFFYIVPFTD
jgi:mono/diheme cytochrome c family protein